MLLFTPFDRLVADAPCRSPGRSIGPDLSRAPRVGGRCDAAPPSLAGVPGGRRALLPWPGVSGIGGRGEEAPPWAPCCQFAMGPGHCIEPRVLPARGERLGLASGTPSSCCTQAVEGEVGTSLRYRGLLGHLGSKHQQNQYGKSRATTSRPVELDSNSARAAAKRNAQSSRAQR